MNKAHTLNFTQLTALPICLDFYGFLGGLLQDSQFCGEAWFNLWGKRALCQDIVEKCYTVVAKFNVC